MPNLFHRVVQTIASTNIGAKLGGLILHHFDSPLLQRSQGRTSLTGIFTGLPTINLTTIGAKSELPRTVPLIGIEDGDQVILIASNWGSQRHPAWYYNLTANPEAELTRHGETKPYIAEEVTGAEREAYWQQAIQLYAGYNNYKERTKESGRSIPIMRLTPKANRPPS